MERGSSMGTFGTSPSPQTGTNQTVRARAIDGS